MQENGTTGLTGNHLKLIAAFSMLLDHAGILLFPKMQLFRILGRLAYPIFAYMIAEGCRYTRNKLRYFLCIFGLGSACQMVYYFVSGDTYLNILLTFSISILYIYWMQDLQKLFAERAKTAVWNGICFLAAVAVLWVLNRNFTIDYGFWGIMTPVLTSLFPGKGKTGRFLPVLMMAVGLVCLALTYGGTQYYALLALPLLLLYSGKRGGQKMKYFFYIFYPAHLAILQGADWLLALW